MSSKIRVTFGSRLQQVREHFRLSQAEMAKQLSISQISLSNYETSKRFPDTNFLEKLHSLYKVDLNWLISGEGRMHNFPEGKHKEIAETANKLMELLRGKR